MSSSPRTALPSALSQALASGRLVVVAGAGISMLPPSNLPSWWAFNQQLLSSIKAAASGLLPAAAHRLLDALSLEGGIPVVAFSDHVVRTFAGPAYFPLLRVLESSRPNANHRALAELARQGRLRAIVTTNFDTLIERAFREAGVDLEVLVGSGSHGVLDGRGRAATALHKVHGSVSDANSLVDTVSQKARGLGHEQRAALERAFAGSHVLFVGFSGADFDFDPDYLPLQGALEAGRSFTWVSRKGSPAPEVARRLARSPDWLVEGELPGWFEALGVDGHAMRGAVDAQPAAVPTPSLQDRIDAWIASPGFGPWACAALCLRLLNDLRLHGERAAFEDWLRVAAEARLDDPGGLDIRADGGIGAALRQLATSALDQGDFPAARAWCERENRFLEALHAKATSLGSLSDRGRREYWCNTAGVYINLALALLRDPGAPDRRQALDAAMNEAGHRARQANDPGLLALLSIGLAQDEERPPTERLRHLRTAQAFAIHAGANQSLIESLHMQARLLMDLSELRLAQIALDDARERLKLATGDALRWAQQALEAALAIREGDADRARAASERMLEIAGQDPPMLKATARQLLADLGWQPDPTDALSTLWDELLARLAGPDPTLAGSLRQAWLDRRADPAALPAFLPAPPKPAGEPGDSDLRAALAWAEFRRDDARCLSCLEALCRSAHARGEAWRLRDLASALSWRAQKSGRTQTAMVAGNYLGVAHELAADLEAAASAWQAALALDDGGRWPGLAATIQANLARILTQAGDVAQAQALFETARATLRAQGSWSNYCVATVNQARLFGQEGQVASAVRLVTDAAALMASRGQERLGAALGQLAIEFGENQAGPNTRMRAWTPSTTWLREAEIHQVDGSSPPAPSPSSAQQLATKAMVSWEAGDEEAGRRLNAEARALYERQGDLAGASRCWNNLAMMQMAADQIPAAIESTRLALALRMRTPDTEGQVMTHATLAALLLRDHRFEASLDVVAEGLILAGSEPGKSWEVVRLHLGGLRAALALQRWAEGRLRCRALAQALQGVDHPQRALVEAEIGEANELLDAVDAVDAARDGEKAEVGAHAMDAVRQARTQARGGNPAQAIAGLEAALRDGGDPAPNGIDRGTLHGELANLLAATDPAGALAHYALSSRAYEEAGRTGMAWHARGVAALLRVDTGAESVESLLSWVDACPEATVSLNVLTGCANVLVARTREGVEERALWEGLRRRLASGIATGRADAETLGRACLQWVGACRACEDKAEASRALELARRHLARSNSRYLDHLSTHESAIGEMKD